MSDTSRLDALAELVRLATAAGPAFAPTETSRLLDVIVETAKELFGAAACSIGLVTEDETEIVFTTATGAGADDFVGTRIPAGTGIAGWVVSTGQPMALSNLREDDRFAADVAADTGYVPNEILAVPVATDDAMLGVLEVLDRDVARADSDDDMRLLTLFATQAALAIRSAQVFAHLGRSVLEAAARMTDDTPLSQALEEVAARPAEPLGGQLAEVAALLGELRTAGPHEHALAVRVLRDMLDYARRRDQRPV